MNWLFKDKIDFLQNKVRRLYHEYADKLPVARDVIEGLPILASLEKNGLSQFDEKHYFLVPFKGSDYGMALYAMRSLPDGVAEINNLPKRRVFHFFDEDGEALLERFLLAQAEHRVVEQSYIETSSIEHLANKIDELDSKLTYGMLFVGGLSALFNPLLGAAIAGKALMPSITGLLNKHGLKPIGEKITKAQIISQVEQARQKVQQDFSCADTIKQLNPILAKLQLLLSEGQLGSDAYVIDNKWKSLTVKALERVYGEVVNNPDEHAAAGIQPDTLHYLQGLLSQNNRQ